MRVSRSDGMGVRLLREAGIPVLILSTERNQVVARRAEKLGVDVLHGQGDKRAALIAWAREASIPLDRIAYVGNDVNDLGCLEAVGWPVVVPGSHPLAAAAARPCAHPPRRKRGRPRARRTRARIAHHPNGRKTLMSVTIGSSRIGGGAPAFVIAEIGLNHNGSVEIAKQLIDVAADAGADAVKFQKRTPEIATPEHMRDTLRETPWGTMTYLEYHHRVEFGRDEYIEDQRLLHDAQSRVVRIAVGRAERRVPRGPRGRRSQGGVRQRHRHRHARCAARDR